MSVNGFQRGEQARLSFVLASTLSTTPSTGVRLVVTDPAGVDTIIGSSALSTWLPSSMSTVAGVQGFYYDLPLDQIGRWTFQYTSTGTVVASDGGAVAVRSPYASTST